MPMSLTPLQKEMLLHRLAVPECISEALLDVDEPKFTQEQIDAAIGSVEEQVNAGVLRNLDECEQAVLVDCCDGSTWLASQYFRRGNVAPGYYQQRTSARKLAARLSDFMCQPVAFREI